MFKSGQTITGAFGKAQAAIRDHAKQVAREQSSEFLKSISRQGEIATTGHVQSEKPSLVPQVDEVSEEEKKKIESDSNSMLARLEAELAQLRNVRQKELEDWQKAQFEKMHPEEVAKAQGINPKKDIIIPTSKPKGPNAAQAAVKAKQGSRETTKQRST